MVGGGRLLKAGVNDKLMKNHPVKDKKEGEEGKKKMCLTRMKGVRAGSVHNYIFCSEQYWESIM